MSRKETDIGAFHPGDRNRQIRAIGCRTVDRSGDPLSILGKGNPHGTILRGNDMASAKPAKAGRNTVCQGVGSVRRIFIKFDRNRYLNLASRGQTSG